MLINDVVLICFAHFIFIWNKWSCPLHRCNIYNTCNIHTYMHACIHTYIPTNIATYLHTYIHTYIYTYIHTYIHICCCLFDALAQASDIQIERRQVVFLCWRQDLNPGPQTPNRQQTGLRHLFASRLNACWQTDWAIEDQLKNLNSTARPYDQQAFSPLDLITSWLLHLALAIYIFVVVNFDALAQASDIRIERRQVVFLCWMHDSNPRCMHACMHTYIQTDTHTDTHTDRHTQTHTYIYTYIHTCMHTCIHT